MKFRIFQTALSYDAASANLLFYRPCEFQSGTSHATSRSSSNGSIVTLAVDMTGASQSTKDAKPTFGGLHVVLDFDGTITTADTISHIVQAAVRQKQNQNQEMKDSIGSKDWTAVWQSIVDVYSSDLSAFAQSHTSAEQRTTLGEEIEYLRGLRIVEQSSLARVAASELFRGFDHAREAGRTDIQESRVTLRYGFKEFMDHLQSGTSSQSPKVHVLSVNWSKAYISGVLCGWHFSQLVANEINSLDGTIHAPPDVLDGTSSAPDGAGPLVTSDDKLAAAKWLLGHTEPGSVVYIGDSTTDLECLVAYGGIVMAPDGRSSLLATLRRLGYEVPHVSESNDQSIRWARDFHEIMTNHVLASLSRETFPSVGP